MLLTHDISLCSHFSVPEVRDFMKIIPVCIMKLVLLVTWLVMVSLFHGKRVVGAPCIGSDCCFLSAHHIKTAHAADCSLDVQQNDIGNW